MLDTEQPLALQRSAEPILAWRTWTLVAPRRGAVELHPIAGRPSWPARRPAAASCPRRRKHPVPGIDCVCGLHATHLPDLLRRTRDPAVIGTVALWGRVVEHELGFRSAFAYPQRLRLVCEVCFWQWGVDAPPPVVVGRGRRRRLLPLCADHVELPARYGYRVRDLRPAREVEQELLGAYGVDLLPS